MPQQTQFYILNLRLTGERWRFLLHVKHWELNRLNDGSYKQVHHSSADHKPLNINNYFKINNADELPDHFTQRSRQLTNFKASFLNLIMEEIDMPQ
jgi:hypothetical protein